MSGVLVVNDKVLWEVMVPCTWNSGRPIRTRHHREWDQRVRKITSGLTVLAVGKGQWVSPDGEEFLERVIPVRILCTPEDMKQIVQLTIKHYEQDAVFYYIVSTHVGVQYATDDQRANFTGVHQDDD